MNLLVKSIEALRDGELIVKTSRKIVRGLRLFVRLTNQLCNSQFWMLRVFEVHEFFVRLRYGEEPDVSVYHLSPTLLETIERWASEQKTRKFSDCISKPCRPLTASVISQEEVQATDRSQEFYDNFPADLLKKVHSEIRKLMKEHNVMKSPFCFVNTRCWLLKKNAESGGGPHYIEMDSPPAI